MIEPRSLNCADSKIQSLYRQITNQSSDIFSDTQLTLSEQIAAFADYLLLVEETQEKSLPNQTLLLYCYAQLAFFSGNFKAAATFAYWSQKSEGLQNNGYLAQAFLYKKALIFFAQYEAPNIEQKVWIQERLKEYSQEILLGSQDFGVQVEQYNELLDLQFFCRLGLQKKLSVGLRRFVEKWGSNVSKALLLEVEDSDAPPLWKENHRCIVWNKTLDYIQQKSTSCDGVI